MRLSIKSLSFTLFCAFALGSPSIAEAAHHHHQHPRLTHGRGHKKHHRPKASRPKAKTKPKEEAAQQSRERGFEL